MERYSGRKGSWVPDYYHEIWSRRDQWQWDMRQRVLDTAAALLDEVGPRLFTVKDVARRSGYARTTVYKYFHHKAGLLAAAEEVRSKRRPARPGFRALPSPLPSPVLSLVYKYLLKAKRAGAVPEETDLQELAHMLCALWWYGLCIRGPHGEPGAPDSLRWLPAALAWLLRGVSVA